MQAEKERIYQIIENMPKEKIREVDSAVRFINEDIGGPESVIIRSKEELIKDLREGIAEVERGEVRPWDEVFSRLKGILR